MSVYPSAFNNSAPTAWIFITLYTWVFFFKSVEKIQGSLKNKKEKTGTLRED